jgi:hypothetical protein
MGAPQERQSPRTSKDPVRLRRAIVVMMSGQGQAVADIVSLLQGKSSTDPDFIAKMRRILELYDSPPADGRVVCVDEFGPLNLLPRKGKTWQFRGRPRRQLRTWTDYPAKAA